jgi:glycosyltransferase involved in cell wall biosynthesis
LSLRKRLKDLIWAAELLKVARPDTHLLIIGDGPQRQRLEGYCQRLAIWDRVHLLGHRDDVDCWIAQLDCVWLAGGGPEGPSAVLMEAMAAGIPVIATDNRCNRELIQAGENGFLVPLGDRAALARKTHLILQDDTLARRLAAAARQRILDSHRVERMVRQYADLYDNRTVPK